MNRMPVVAVLAGVVLLAAATPTVAAGADSTAPRVPNATPLERVSAYVQPSVVYEQLNWTGYLFDKVRRQYLKDGQPFQIPSQCTGFVVNPDGYIATAGHCVDRNGQIKDSFLQMGAEYAAETGYYGAGITAEDIVAADVLRVEGFENRSRPDLEVLVGWGASASGLETNEQMPARVASVQSFEAGDVALLKVDATDLNAVPLAAEPEVGVGTEVVSIGYPASVDLVTDPDFSPSFKEGSISSVKTIQEGLLTVYEISAAVSGGMSGGPTVNLDGQVVGVNSFGISGETQQFNFVRPVDMVEEVMGGAGVENELSATSEQYRRGLDAYFAGNKALAVRVLRAVVAEQPANAMAQDYLDKSRDLPNPPTPAAAGGLPTLLLVGGSLVLLLVAAGGGLLLRRRRGRQPATATSEAPVTVSPATTAAGPVSGPPPMSAGDPPTVPTGFVHTPPLPPGAEPQTLAMSTGPTAPPREVAQPAEPAGTVTAPRPSVPSQRQPDQFCTACGNQADPGERYCGTCGHQL